MTAISVENLSKKYIINHASKSRDGMRHAIEEAMRSPFRWLRERRAATAQREEEFWALSDVSFTVNQGDVVGVIGKNGAGKSTLLKILSRITEPTGGKIRLRGRIASLLEVGTGFHQELTGRENIYLNGAILGMSRSEISRRFDEIVAFSEIDQFLDTPVKRYSSGMYVRLAFSVAAHLEPEVLIVDEVLAVGDTAFQQKCLERIRSVSDSGRTVIFVSHQLATVRTLCKKGLLLEKGTLRYYGDTTAAISHYLSSNGALSGSWERSRALTENGISFTAVRIRNNAGESLTDITCNEHFTIQITLIAEKLFTNVQIALRLTNQEGIAVFTTCNTDETRGFIPFKPGTHVFGIPMDAAYLMPGRYTLTIAAHIPQERALDLVDSELSFTIHDTGNHVNVLKDNRAGVVSPVISWTTR